MCGSGAPNSEMTSTACFASAFAVFLPESKWIHVSENSSGKVVVSSLLKKYSQSKLIIFPGRVELNKYLEPPSTINLFVHLQSAKSQEHWIPQKPRNQEEIIKNL